MAHDSCTKKIRRLKKFMHEIQPVTGPWGSLLVRMLRVIDAIELWDTLIVEKLYIRSGGQVDKLFPVRGDILSVYLVADRIYKNSPQGWYIVTATQFRNTDAPKSPYFWARCTFHSDIPPIPDTAVPWRGTCDPWLMRDKLTNKPMWLRLCSTEEFGCSYYNLSDWIKAKRTMCNDTPVFVAGRGKVTLPSISRTTRSSRKCLSPISSPIRTRQSLRKSVGSVSKSTSKRRRGRSKYTEYIVAESLSDSSESCQDERRFAETRIVCQTDSGFDKSLFTLTTGKMSNYSESASISTSANGSSRVSPSGYALSTQAGTKMQILPYPTGFKSRLCKDPRWTELREETADTFFNLILARLNVSFPHAYAKDIAGRLEDETVFSKCMRSEDRYIGLRRAVCGILKQFDCLLDSLEALIPVDNELRDKLTKSTPNDELSDQTVSYGNFFSSYNIP